MYRILVVDDQKVEVETITWLLRKHHLPLIVSQAFHGEDALAQIKNQHFDILFTDIKMPFIDGLELASRAKEMRPDLKVIIYSAFGEFDYARKAIQIGVAHYILKPIVVEQFLEIMNQVIDLCDLDRQKNENKERLIQGYERAVQYERGNLFHALLHGYEWDEYFQEKIKFAGISLQDTSFQMLLVDLQDRFFDLHNYAFESRLAQLITDSYFYLNLNERQGILIFMYPYGADRQSKVRNYANEMKRWITEQYGMRCFIVIGSAVHDPQDLHAEYDRMEQQLDYRFYLEGSIIWDKDKSLVMKEQSTDDVEQTIHEIYKQIESADFHELPNHINILIGRLKNAGHYSPLYTKTVFTGILRKIGEEHRDQYPISMNRMSDQIAKIEHLTDLHRLINTIIEALIEQKESNGEENRKVIGEVMKYIDRHYSRDIGLQDIAEHVYLSPSYLTFIFKKHAGKSLGKYITEIRFEKAKYLLENTNMKSSEIGKYVGYPNPSYFTMMFRNRYGCTPVQYRERMK